MFSVTHQNVEGLGFQVSELIYVEHTLTKKLGFKFEVSYFSGNDKILIKVDTKDICGWE